MYEGKSMQKVEKRSSSLPPPRSSKEYPVAYKSLFRCEKELGDGLYRIQIHQTHQNCLIIEAFHTERYDKFDIKV